MPHVISVPLCEIIFFHHEGHEEHEDTELNLDLFQSGEAALYKIVKRFYSHTRSLRSLESQRTQREKPSYF